jgi:hypothetical protein
VVASRIGLEQCHEVVLKFDLQAKILDIPTKVKFSRDTLSSKRLSKGDTTKPKLSFNNPAKYCKVRNRESPPLQTSIGVILYHDD